MPAFKSNSYDDHHFARSGINRPPQALAPPTLKMKRVPLEITNEDPVEISPEVTL